MKVILNSLQLNSVCNCECKYGSRNKKLHVKARCNWAWLPLKYLAKSYCADLANRTFLDKSRCLPSQEIKLCCS